MLILSWNVAGLSKTVEKIDRQYGDEKKRRRDPSAVVGDFFKRHGADIVCIQEAKIPKSLLESRREPLHCAHIEGYESFWSLCIDSSKRGFNGVVTYCKKGTVVTANARPFDNPELDDQGRCVMTDHGKFVIFNVYVPAGGANPLSYKMKFLDELRDAMRTQREKYNKSVILVGDLNISHTEKDVFWGSRKLAINNICQEVKEKSLLLSNLKHTTHTSITMSPLPQWKVDLATAWPEIEKALKSKKTVMVTTTNPRTNAKFEKYRIMVNIHGKQILLGNHEEKVEYCKHNFDFEPFYYLCSQTGEQILCQEGNTIAVTTVAELMLKLGRIEWDQDLQKRIASTDGVTSQASPPRKWLNKIIGEDQMIDCFRFFYPNAEGRFTCWEQFKNKRYENQGARIDFTLIDNSLLQYLRKGDVRSMRCGGCGGKHDPNSESAAFCAVTANGGYQPVSFQGGGIIEASQKVLDTQFGTPHTGHIYTPPSFSDHIAISVLLDDSCCSYNLVLNDQDKQTKAAQPHKKARTITSFFGPPKTSREPNGIDRQQHKLSNIIYRNSKSVGTKRKGPMDDFLNTAKSQK